MPIQGDVKNLYSDREKTRALFPTTKVSAVSDDNGVGLDALMENLLYSGIEVPEASSVPLDADTLEGHPASDFATPSFVTSEIAKAQLSGGSGGDIDLSGFATKDDVNNAVRAIDYPVDSVNGKTGAVQLSASDVSASPAGFGLGGEAKRLTSADDVNTTWQSGWYHWGADAPQNAPKISAYGTGYAAMRVDGANANNFVQTLWSGYSNVLQVRMTRRVTEGVASDWVRCDPYAFAPSGYGLGEANGKVVSTPNDAINNGFYNVKNDNYTGDGTTVDWRLGWTSLLVERRGDAIAQTAKYGDVIWYRTSPDGGATWNPWEWVNPPMQLGVEYRTTERCEGNPVYVKRVDCGKGTSTGAMNMFPKIGTNIVYTDINCRAKGTSGWGMLLNHLLSFAGSPANEDTVSLAASQDLTAYNIYLTVKYYKV